LLPLLTGFLAQLSCLAPLSPAMRPPKTYLVGKRVRVFRAVTFNLQQELLEGRKSCRKAGATGTESGKLPSI